MKKKIIILISIITMISILLIFLLINNNREKIKELTINAEVIALGSNYLLVTTEENTDYIINTNDTNYNIGDILELKIELKDYSEAQTPYEATAKNISVITKTSIEETEDKKNITNNKSTKEEQKTESPTNQNNNNQKEDNYSESNIINYFEDLNIKLKNYNNEHDIGKEIKSKFVTCIDFLFYDKEIDSKTFKELTNSAKLKILELTMSIDSKIDSVFPGYKDSIQNKYQNIKNKTIELYLNTTTDICNNDKDLCEIAKEGFSDLKDNFGITWELIKDLASQGIIKLKDWYEIWRYN